MEPKYSCQALNNTMYENASEQHGSESHQFLQFDPQGMSDQGSNSDGHDTSLPNMRITAREHLTDFMTVGEPQLRLCAPRGMQDVGRRMSVDGCTMAGVKRKASALGLD